MANSNENSPNKPTSPKNDPAAATAPAAAGANPDDDAAPPVQVPVPAGTLQFGEGSSSVPVNIDELVAGSSSSSSSSTASSPGGTPPRRVTQIVIGGTGTGGTGGGGGEGAAKKKRALPSSGKKDDDGKVVEKKPRKKGEMDAPESDPVCPVCGKKFGSWKGVFGHLRAHPERQWRGAFPPPKGEVVSWSPIKIGGPDDHQAIQVQLLAPTLLELAHETLAKMREESTIGASTARPTGAGSINLNQKPSSSSSPSPPPQAGARGSGSGLDLNKPPLAEKEDGSNGNE